MSGARAPILVRAVLTLHGTPAPLALLQQLALHVSASTFSGGDSSHVVSDFKLDAATGEATHSVLLPDRCSRVAVRLVGRVQLVVLGTNGEAQYQELEASKA